MSAIEFTRQREGWRGWLVRRSAYIYRGIHDLDCLKRRLLQHFIAQLELEESDYSNRGAIKSLQEM